MRATITTKETREDALRRRLIPYWKMEAWSAVLIPALVIWSAPPHTAAETAAAIFSLFAVSLQLVVGARYWFVVVKRMLGNQSPVVSLMRILDRVQLPLVFLVGISWIVTVHALVVVGWSGAVIAAFICSGLETLEYVNYFHLQLQNFDHAPDIKRLMNGGGLRRAHMAKDLAAFRKTKQR